MNHQITRAILVVSFGTAVTKARTLTLDAIENAIHDAYPDRAHYRAWTSSILRKKVLESEHINIDSVTEALSHIKQDGICDVFIQPTFVTNGNEYHKLCQEAMAFRDQFTTLRIGSPLLESEDDLAPIISALANKNAPVLTISALATNNLPLPADEFFVFMGHGTTDGENQLYRALDTAFKAHGFNHIFVKTMQSTTAIDEIISIARERGISKIILAPFMIAAGHHALKEMAGDHENSWKSQLEQAGFTVQCIMKGLGENPAIHQLFIHKIDKTNRYQALKA